MVLSTILFRYFTCRSREQHQSSPSLSIVVVAFEYPAFLATVMVRGFTVWGGANALQKNRFAASASRLADSRK
jgi:hypothetical protein